MEQPVGENEHKTRRSTDLCRGRRDGETAVFHCNGSLNAFDEMLWLPVHQPLQRDVQYKMLLVDEDIVIRAALTTQPSSSTRIQWGSVDCFRAALQPVTRLYTLQH